MSSLEEVDLLGGLVAARLGKVSDLVRAEQETSLAERDLLRVEIVRLTDVNKDLAAERDLHERRMKMFRRALFVYLQERDGPAGKNAPTAETLQLIRDLTEGSVVVA